MKRILERPIISEKSRDASAANQVFSFAVSRSATKPEVKKEVENRYHVTVRAVRIINERERGKKWKGLGGRVHLTKKALVQLKPGETIEAFNI